MDENILEIKDLTVTYGGEDVLKDVSIDVKRGEVLCIVGESGCGKSTLIRSVCMDSDVMIRSGTISYEDNLLMGEGGCSNRSRRLLGTDIGLIQQNPWGAFNPIRRYDVQLKETFKSHGKRYDENKVKRVFGMLGLKSVDAILRSCPYEMSGGMSQRVAIASAFVLEPRLLLCDEITSSLDVTTAAAVIDELTELKRKLGTTVVIVTHNLGIAKRVADRIAIMYNGRIVECGDVHTILDNSKHEYTKKLISNVPRLRVV